MQHQTYWDQPLPPEGVNKWEALRALSTARQDYGLSDRDLSVLQALLSFHPGTDLGSDEAALVVYPSNASICDRLNGMPNSTMRRHLARLVDAGVLLRRDSPNGKRYSRTIGNRKVAYGFDLTPLAVRHAEFCAAAEAVNARLHRVKRLREQVSLMRRDVAGLAEYGARLRPDLNLWDALSDLARLTARDLRRKLSEAELARIEQALSEALDQARDILEPQESDEVSTSESRIEQHHQNSDINIHVLEPDYDKIETEPVHPYRHPSPEVEDTEGQGDGCSDRPLPNIPLGMVLSACREILAFADRPIRHWHHLVRAADIVSPMMGISPSAWADARRCMGPEAAAVVVAAMLERVSEIRSPGGYLRALTAEAATSAFSCGPMVMALMKREAA